MLSTLNDFICQLENALQTDDSGVFADLWQSFIEQRLDLFCEKFPFWNAPCDTICLAK